MTCYSVQPRDRIFLKGYRFLSFCKSMGKNIGKCISKNLSSKYSRKILDHVKQSSTTASKRVTQKLEEASGDLIGYKIADKITKVFKTSPKNNSETNEKKYLEKDMHP